MSQMTRYRLAPDVPGITFRHALVPDDFSAMNAIANATRRAEGAGWTTSDQEFRTFYEHLSNSDIGKDVVVATRDGQVVGYGRSSWRQEPDGPRLYEASAFTGGEEGNDLIEPIIETMERRCRDIAGTHPPVEKFFDTVAGELATARVAVLLARGYVPVRHFFSMVRPNLDELPNAPLPEGLEIRPVHTDQLREIFDAEMEAFRDHWGFTEPTDATYEQFVSEAADTDRSLWRVAWDGDRIAGMVRGYISDAENEAYARKRGYVEHISVRRPWRRRGLARALIGSTITALRERGMAEGALGVDSENPSGALRLYEACGFVTVSRAADYRKPLALSRLPN